MLITLRQAEKLTGYSTDTLRRKIKDGSLPTIMEKNRYMIEEKDLAPYVKKVAKSRVHEQSHVEREVPQGNPFQLFSELLKYKQMVEVNRQQMEVNRQQDLMQVQKMIEAIPAMSL